METGIHIGHKIDREVIETKAEAILQILNARADQKTIRQALKVLEKVTALPPISDLSVSDCNLSGDQSTTQIHGLDDFIAAFAASQASSDDDDDPEAFE